uniref:Uncharacterized protein n=1 Tax=uncultured prokaryote TaxID=198431 RepID=A0A0H5QNM0_9ZZZZ|nr:hypothetical protein [uncultured prokaryote]
MIRIQAVYTGLVGMPAVNSFFFNGNLSGDADDCAERVGGFFEGFKAFMSDDVTVTVQNEAVLIDPITGEQMDFFTVDGQTWVGEATVDPLPIGSSIIMSYGTSGVVNGRRVIGRNFLAGADEGVNGPGGLITASIPPVLVNLAEESLGFGAPLHVVWSRPIDGGRPGSIHGITSYNIRPGITSLRTRRR